MDDVVRVVEAWRSSRRTVTFPALEQGRRWYDDSPEGVAEYLAEHGEKL